MAGARIDDLLYVDVLTKHSDRFSLVPVVSLIGQQKVSRPLSVSVSGTPRKPAIGTPSFSPAQLIGRTRGERTPFLHNNNIIKPQPRGFGVRRVLSNYLGVETKAKICGNSAEVNCSKSSTNKTENQQLQRE